GDLQRERPSLQAIDHVKRAVDAGEDPGSADELAIVDVPLTAHPVHTGIAALDPIDVSPVRGRPAAVDQPARGKHLCAGADAHHDALVESVLPHAVPGRVVAAKVEDVRDYDQVRSPPESRV